MFIHTEQVKAMIQEQFPQYASLVIQPVVQSGHDNHTFHLGESMSIRLPSGEAYVAQVEKEIQWLPKLKPYLPLPISEVIAKGEPCQLYPFPWTINRYLPGVPLSYDNLRSQSELAIDLASFLHELQQIDTTNAPVAGAHNFYRGGPLQVYDQESKKALMRLEKELPTAVLKDIWEKSLQSDWAKQPVWIHGDIAPGNLLMEYGKLAAVIDFGIMGIGDPACDYAMAWTFFDSEARSIFLKEAQLNQATIARAKGWALWKALITYHDGDRKVANLAQRTLLAILAEII